MRPAARRRLHRLAWDAVTVLAIAGIIWGVLEYAGALGWPKALAMGVIMVLAGYLGLQVIYPLWFGRD
jgi:hypothetical protein